MQEGARMIARRNRMIPALFILPSLLFLGIFIYIPLVQNFYNSFFDFSVFSPTKEYVGFSAFEQLFADKVVMTALINNIKYAIISVIFQVAFALVLATILEDKLFRRIAPMLRVIYFIPVMISISVIALLFNFIYNPQMGLLNSFLELIGLGNLTVPW